MHEVAGSKVYRLFYPSVPVIVAARFDGRISAMPVVSILSVSSSPPRVAFSSSTSHRTYEAIVRSKSFSAVWLDTKFIKSVENLGTSSSGTAPDKLGSAGLTHHGGRVLDVPVIDGASAVLECSVSEVRTLGDHDLVVGEVMVAYAEEDFADYWAFKGYSPILYSGMVDGFRVYRG